MPLPEEIETMGRDLRELPGGVSNATHGEGVRRGVGYAVGFKNIGFSAGFDDYSTARVSLSVEDGQPVARVHTAAVEVGQGLVMVQAQIVRSELGVENVIVETADTRIGSAGSTSASRQSYMTGGAVKQACEAVRERIFERVSEEFGEAADELSISGENVVADGRVAVSLSELLDKGTIEETVEFHHRATHPLDEDGQGDVHLQYAFAAHRAVVEVDVELGLVRVVEIATAQDVGKVINPLALEGQIEGGIAQGLGLALMEGIRLKDGKIQNASFTDYLIPTILDMPPVRMEILELADPEAPYGLKGVGEPPTIASTPAIVAALRDATGKELIRIPVRPEHIAGLEA
jgi:CO/xanthine dehydrogenase Mo-binding subunit